MDTKDTQAPRTDVHAAPSSAYRPPSVTYLGTIAELTQKEVGGADGSTFMGLDIGS